MTGLVDGAKYDIHIRYRRVGASVFSIPLQINNYTYVGASGLPDDVTEFMIAVAGESALFKWLPNDDIDLAGYRLRFTSAFSGASWGTSQLLENLIGEARVTLPFQSGTYLIKAVDLLGNESANATTIVTYDQSALRNVVATLTESSDFLGTKDNTQVQLGTLILADTALDGYYYFDNDLDLGAVYISQLAANIVAGGAYVNDIFDMDDLFAEDDLFAAGGSNDIFTMDDIFTEEDIFGIGSEAWLVQLQYRITDDDPAASPTWSAWTEFAAGSQEFRAVEFRVLMRSLADNISPQITTLEVSVDMPDRIERGEDLVVLAAGATVVYSPAFKEPPAVLLTIQDGAVDDRIEFTAKSASGFTFRVYNGDAAGYVDRTYDYIVSGYGRVN